MTDIEKMRDSVLKSSLRIEYKNGCLSVFDFSGSSIGLSFILADIMETIIKKNPNIKDSVCIACDYVREIVSK